MSRIIKSKHLVIKEPCVLGAARENLGFEPDGGKNISNPCVELELEADTFRAQMAEVVRETENMVTELMENAQIEAQHIIASAEEEAASMKEQAAKEAEAIRKKALEEGYQEGLAKAWQEMEEVRRKAISECENMLKEAEKTREAIILSAEEEILNLALAIARKIIDKEVRENSDIIINLIQKTLATIGNAGNVKIRVNPHDFETVLENKDTLTAGGQTIDDLEIQLDSRITPGGFVVESDLGIIDARLETRMDKVEQALREEAKNSGKSIGF